MKESAEDRVYKLEKRLDELYNDLKNSALNLDQIEEAIKTLQNEPESFNELEDLYAKEFALAVDNSSIYEHIERISDKLLSLDSSNFKARRLKKEADKYLRVQVIDV